MADDGFDAAVGYDAAFTFVYSPRNGTKAAEFPDQIPEEVKQQRIVQLVALQNEQTYRSNLAYVGKTERVLIEEVSRRDEKSVCGRTDSGKMVNMEGAKGYDWHICHSRNYRSKAHDAAGEDVRCLKSVCSRRTSEARQKTMGRSFFRKRPAHLLIGTFAPGFARKTAMASFIEGELASMAQVGERLFLNGKSLPGNLVRGVATAKIYEGKGCASQLLSHILQKELAANGQALSVLKTFIHPFYRRLGYEVYSRRLVRKAEPSGGAACAIYTSLSEISDEVLEELLNCYRSYLRGKSGYVYRDLPYLRSMLEEVMGQSGAWLLALGAPVCAYCIAYAEAEELYAEEAVYQNKEDLTRFAQAAKEQGKGFSYLCFEGQEPDAMARAVSVQRLLEETVCAGSACIEVIDNVIEQNAGIWKIKAGIGGVTVTKTIEPADVSLNSGELAVLCLGKVAAKAAQKVSSLWKKAQTGIFEQY